VTVSRGALSAITVVDFSRVLAGPYATMLLADLGADVVKIERPGSGDDTRGWGPPYVGDQTTYFAAVNRNKRSVALDLGSAEGLAAAREIIRAADVVVENFRPGVMERLGLGYDAVAALNPGAVYCSISGFGAGAGAGLPGYDLLVQAVGGLMSITGEADGEPAKVGVAVVDVITGLHASIGILAALRHRDRTGEGQHVEVSLLSSLLSALVNQASGYVAAGVVPQRMGNQHPSVAPYEEFRVADGSMVLAVGNDRQFAALCEVLAVPALAADPRFTSNPSRVTNRAALHEVLSHALLTRTGREWFDLLTAAAVPCGPIQDVAAAFALAEELGLQPVVAIRAADGTISPQVANPIGLSRTPPSYRLAPPRLGEHTPQSGAETHG
jgi:crotonobetainyl-CoA:carnitine CoA-transferase CaiB-like acyl-CoA transferase